MVVTKALAERGFSFPPSDFFSEILKAYGLQPHNISPNSILAISNHVTLCEGHLRVTQSSPSSSTSSPSRRRRFLKLPLWPPAEQLRSSSALAASILPPTAMNRVLPAFKNGPASETPAWTVCPHLSESQQLTRAVRRICKLTEDGMSGKDLTMSWFTKRIQPLQHRDHLMFQYTGRDDLMHASKDNLSADAVDKRIQLLIKIPRDLRIHVCNMDIHTNGSRIALEELEEKDLETLVRVPHSGTNDPEAASDVEVPETSEVLPKASSSAKPDPNDVINLDDLPEEPTAESGKGDSSKGASSPAPPPERPDVTSAEAPADDVENKLLLSRVTSTPQTHPHLFPVLQRVPLSQRHAEISSMMDKVWGPANTKQQELNELESGLKVFFAKHKDVRQNTRKLHEDLHVHVLEQKTEIKMLQKRDAESQKAIATLETRLKNYEEQLAKNPSVDELSAELEVLKAEHDSLQEFLKESTEKETREKKEQEEKHAQAIAELNDKLNKSNTRIKTLEATTSRTEAYEDARNSINDLFEACRGIAKSLNLKRAGTTVIDRMSKLMRMVSDLIKDWQVSSSRGAASLTLAMCKGHFPAMDFAAIARGVPKGTNIKAALAETQGYDMLLAERVDHSFWYNKYDLPEGFSDAEDDKQDEDLEEGSGSSADQSGEDSGDASAYVASEDEDHVFE
ncbi:hypothetical protein QYE76_005208 [Lolium multiflorum]|uniref:Transposase (putative) gypsy type domain-containing protein n=1 Tax=Lolium multiflorum TaxID=4521 RepID=A0AAD8RTG0_LOLMU|nr:hypothetical protein QYE76_005208 [Lolium multiflorum]